MLASAEEPFGTAKGRSMNEVSLTTDLKEAFASETFSIATSLERAMASN